MPVPPEDSRGEGEGDRGARGHPDNANRPLEWTPIRGGVSADGQHGFTVGYMTLHRPDGTRVRSSTCRIG